MNDISLYRPPVRPSRDPSGFSEALLDSETRSEACERFGISARTIRRWRVRIGAGGVLDLVPRYPVLRQRHLPAEVMPLIEQARRELAYGATRTRVWLRRVHQVSMSMGTIRRVSGILACRTLRRYPKRRPLS